MATLNDLAPAYQQQYDALVPQIELSVRQANQGRGMFYSGQATDAETKAKADLLAKLAAQQATDEQQTAMQRRSIAADSADRENATKAASRSANLGLIGTGVGTAATLAGLKYLNPSNGLTNVVSLGNGQFGRVVNGEIVPMPVKGAGVGVGEGIGGPGTMPGAASGAPMAGVGPEASGIPSATGAPTSMWQNLTAPGGGALNPYNLGAGAAGGGLGYLSAGAINGKGSTNADVGSGVGGAAGYGLGVAAANHFGSSSPWMAGLGALAGSFGGGLLGNLFK